METSESDKDLYCSGLPFEGRRTLSADELAALRRDLSLARRRFLTALWMGRAAFFAAGAGIGGAAYLGTRMGDSYVEREAMCFGAAIFIPALLGTFQEILAGYTARLRIVFASALALLILAAWQLDAHPAWVWLNVPLGAGWLVAIFGGWAAVLLRWKTARDTLPVVQLGVEDAASGEVQRFAMPEAPENAVEILPQSRAAFSIRGLPRRDWSVLYVARLAHAPAKAAEAPWYGAPRQAPPGSPDYTQRHLTPEEAQEIAGLCPPMLRRAIARWLGVTYFAAVFLRMLENMLTGRLTPALSPFGWVLAFVAGGLEFLRRYKLWQGLRKDAEERIAVIIRKAKADGATLVTTLLPRSGLVWDNAGRPASWRTVKWW